MRTLPTVLLVVVLNDLLLAYVLGIQLTPPVIVVGGAGLLSLTIYAVVASAFESGVPPSRRELQAELDALRSRVDELEAAED